MCLLMPNIATCIHNTMKWVAMNLRKYHKELIDSFKVSTNNFHFSILLASLKLRIFFSILMWWLRFIIPSYVVKPKGYLIHPKKFKKRMKTSSLYVVYGGNCFGQYRLQWFRKEGWINLFQKDQYKKYFLFEIKF